MYLAQSRAGYLKAGVSVNPTVRLQGIPYDVDGLRPEGIGSDRRLTLLHYAPGTRTEEVELHKRLSDWRIVGTCEWYKDCSEAREVAIAFINNPIALIQEYSIAEWNTMKSKKEEQLTELERQRRHWLVENPGILSWIAGETSRTRQFVADVFRGKRSSQGHVVEKLLKKTGAPGFKEKR